MSAPKYPNFIIGDRVVCVYEGCFKPHKSFVDTKEPIRHPLKGKRYTIKDFTLVDNRLMVSLEGSTLIYHHQIFRKVDDVDMKFVNRIIRKSKPNIYRSLLYSLILIKTKLFKK